MGEIRWIILGAIAILSVHAAPRELNSDELITEPRPGEEYVNIQTGGQAPPLTQPQKVDLQANSFSTSHRISQPKPKFQTAHKIQPKDETNHHKDGLETSASELNVAYYDDEEEEPTTTQAPVEVVTRTSVKMSKSKKVQKPVVKSAHDVKLDIKSSEGVIDERGNADEEEKKIMEKKFSTEAPKIEKKKFVKFNVPFEDDETETVATTTKAPQTTTTPDSTTVTLTTTEEPPITTFNYKNVYEKSKKTKEVIEIIPEGDQKIKQEKYKYETVANESLKTAESRTQNGKKDTKQEKKDKHHEILKKEDVGFDVVHINRNEKRLKEDNFDFFDADEKVLVPAGSSPGQSSRINIKKGPNGQDYEYEYVYYYYDEDEEGANGTVNLKEGKVVASTTERVYNGHDGPAVDEKFHTVPQTSTNGNKYLPTEAPKTTQRSRTKPEYIEVEEEIDEELPVTRGGSNSNGNRYSSINRHVEPVNNEVLPATTRATTRARGRIQIPGAHPVPIEDIPPIADERLPANTRFPPRSRSNNVATSPQPQETTTRTRSRENPQNSQRVKLPNLGLLDSSSFRTHASDASDVEDPIYEPELQRRPPSRAQTTTEAKYEDTPRRGTRPTTASTTTTESYYEEEEVVSSRRPVNRRPDERTRQKVYEEEEERFEKISGNARRPETTRESDAEEGQGLFEVTKTPYTSISRPSTELRGNDITTENQSIIGLTNAMMNKVAHDLYAILQAQNENIRTNFVDANSTDVTTDSEEISTEYSTTTTTTEPTTTTTTTTTQAPQPTGRGRYKTRGGSGVNISKSRTRVSSGASSTTEPATETSSTTPRTRGRFHPNSNRVNNQPTIRRTSPKPRTEDLQDDVAVKEEAPKQNSEKTFGERPNRNRYRPSGRASTTTTTSAPSGVSATSASRSNSLDRYNSRRRGSTRVSSTTHQPSTDEASDEADTHHEASRVTEETSAATPALKPSRARLPATGARPLRPGPRVPLSQLTQRGRTSTTTTQAPLESEEIEKEVSSAEEQHAPQVVEEVQEQPTTPADALTRLRNRQRLHVNPNAPKRQTPPPPAQRRKLLTPSLKRKQVEEKAIEKIDENVEEEKTQEEGASEEEQAASPSTASTSTTAEPETKSGLSGLLGRRRNFNRKPGTLQSRTQNSESS